MSNIDDFNMIVGLVFSKLYENFPVGVDVGSVEITTQILDGKLTRGEVAKDFEGRFPGNDPFAESLPSQEGDEAERLFTIYEAAMNWLGAEGYIRFDNEAIAQYFGCVLTLRGLQALSLVPGGITTSTTLGDKIMEATKEGALSGVREWTKKAFTEIPAWVYRESTKAWMEHNNL